MTTAPLHLITDPAKRDVKAWNSWRVKNGDGTVDLANVDLAGAHLPGVNLSRAKIDGANFTGATLVGANLQEAAGRRVKFGDALLTAANLDRAEFPESSFAGATIDGAYCWRAQLYSCRFTDVFAAGVVLANADLNSSTFRGDSRTVDLSAADIRGARLSGARMSGVDLTGANLANVRMLDAELADVDFISADLSGAEIDGLKIGSGVCFDDTTCYRVRGGITGVIVGSVPVGDGSHTSARRNSDGTVTIWSDCDTDSTSEAPNEFSSTDDYLAAAEAEGGPWIEAKRAWAKFAEANLIPVEIAVEDAT